MATSFALGRVRPRRVLIAVGAALLIGACVLALARSFQPQRSSQVFDPPVLAGQQLWGACAGGFYARHGNAIVVTSSFIRFTWFQKLVIAGVGGPVCGSCVLNKSASNAIRNFPMCR